MKLLDLNILLYAVNRDAALHDSARDWVQEIMNGEEPVALAWVVLLGFLRVTTNPRILPAPLGSEEAMSVIDGWLRLPITETLEPGREHWRILKELVTESGTAGNLTTDAHLAALAIEHGCQLCSTDSDFGRFTRLNWKNPLRAH